MGYVTGTQRLILALIITADGSFSVHDKFYVVNNPVNRSYTLCLPLLVVSYGNVAHPSIPWITSAQQPLPPPFISSATTNLQDGVNPKTDQWISPFRWHWTTDDQKLEPYPDTLNALLENLYQSFLQNANSNAVNTPTFTRDMNGVSQNYYVDFANNTQKNISTGYIRNIKRTKMMSKSLNTSRWMFLNEKATWVPYEKEAQSKVESAYQNHKTGAGPSTLKIHFSKTGYEYHLDFNAMNQKNLYSQAVRNIKRKSVRKGEWKFLNENDIWVAYEQQAQSTVESAFKKYLSKNGPCSIKIRFANCLDEYKIDFVSGKQTNLYSMTERKIIRASSDASVWKFLNENGVWIPYDIMAQNKVEESYQSYVAGSGASIVNMQFSASQYKYSIDFTAMSQRNLSTGTSRGIMRDSGCTAVWKFLNENGIWVSYDAQAQGAVESAYQKYLTGNGCFSIKVRFSACQDEYSIDFQQMVQTNLYSRTRRNVMRG